MLISILVLGSVFIGALLQRITGLGVGLVSGPVLSSLLGPLPGVTMVNGLSTINAANNAWSVRKNTRWRAFRLLASSLVAGTLPGLFVVHLINGPWLLVAVGGLVLLALAVATFNPKGAVFSQDAAAPMVITGLVAGFMSVIAGIAGPSMNVYCRLAGWDYREFIATMHPVILIGNFTSFMLKAVLLGGFDIHGVPTWIWFGAIAMIFAGAWFGDRVDRHLSTTMARRLATILATIGASVVLLQGLTQLI